MINFYKGFHLYSNDGFNYFVLHRCSVNLWLASYGRSRKTSSAMSVSAWRKKVSHAKMKVTFWKILKGTQR